MKQFGFIKFFLSALALTFLLDACTREETSSPIPNLEYTGYSKVTSSMGKDSFVVINLTFRDGDGDIGLGAADSFPPYRYGNRYHNNLFVEFYSIENGVASKVQSQFVQDTLYGDTINFSQRIENLTPEGKNKFIKGRIEVLTPFFNLDLSATRPDSVYYELILFDRALNQSPVVRTPIIVLNL